MKIIRERLLFHYWSPAELQFYLNSSTIYLFHYFYNYLFKLMDSSVQIFDKNI